MGKVNLELGSFFLVPDWSKSYNLTSLMTEIQKNHFFRIESQVFSISLKCLIFWSDNMLYLSICCWLVVQYLGLSLF